MIRKATRGDIETIAGFQALMAKETEDMDLDRDTVLQGVKAVLDDLSKGFYLVTEKKGEVIGCLMVTPEWSDWRNQTVWWIQSLYVRPEWRKSGIFREMYNYLKDRVEKDDSIGGIRLYVDKSNTRAQKVYEALGMDGEHYRFYEDMKNNM
jgi:ribosomal protein S18 acetylase RimI-like enzyme